MSKLQKILPGMIHGLKKYKYALLIVLLGVFLLLLPSDQSASKEIPAESEQKEDPYENYGMQVEQRLEDTLSQIEGVGKVKVILTMKQGSTNHYLYDSNILRDKAEDTESVREERKTVLFSKGNSYDEATVTTVEYPMFQGALIVCEGGARPEIQLQLIQAVSALTNLRSDRITVVKMK